MSIITEALKKRQKEVGPEEVQEIVPVSLDDPSIVIPRDRTAGRWVSLAGIVLVAGIVVITVVMLSTEFLSGKPKEETGDSLASLPQPQEESIQVGQPQPSEQTPPENVSEPRPAATMTTSTPSETSLAKPSPMPAREQPTPAVQPALTTAAEVLPETGISSIPPTEPPVVPPPDPFAGITLQGIMWFDPTAPEALINGKTLKVGDSIDGIKVIQIGRESVRLRLGDIERVISYE